MQPWIQANGIAESFVNTCRRDYVVSRMDLTDAATVLDQLPVAFKHFNEVHPHSSLKMRSPREFRRLSSMLLKLFMSVWIAIANS